MKRPNFLMIRRSHYKRLVQAQKEVNELKKGINSALRIKDLWLISDENCLPEHESEAQALCKMRDTFLELLKDD